eukprot:2417469-Pyramimonas_sp.AAC.1
MPVGLPMAGHKARGPGARRGGHAARPGDAGPRSGNARRGAGPGTRRDAAGLPVRPSRQASRAR